MDERIGDTGEVFGVTPAPLLGWTRNPPDLATLRAGVDAAEPPPDWPPLLRSRWPALKRGMFLYAVHVATVNAATFGMEDGEQLCRLLAAVAQTFLPENQDAQRRNRQLAVGYRTAAYRRIAHQTAQQASPSPSQPAAPPTSPVTKPLIPPVETREDERGAGLSLSTLSLRHASHVGPKYPSKPENQDATYATAHGTTVIFALADGVSTSTGARLAAAFVVSRFCESVKRELEAGNAPDGACVTQAIRTTQHALDEYLHEVLASWDSEDHAALYGSLPRETALRILQNTADPKRAQWGPAMATTFIGGLLDAADSSDGFPGVIVRLGDGIVEQVDRHGSVTTRLDMDRTETAISTFVGPGPRGEAALDSIAPVSVSLAPGDALLISSDGLVRGHDAHVWQKLSEILDKDLRGLLDVETAAKTLLDEAAERADRIRNEERGSELFADNLSLIVVMRRGAADDT